MAPSDRAIGQVADAVASRHAADACQEAVTRFPDALAELLSAHRPPAQLIEAEQGQALEHRLTAPANRSLLGVMNQFGYLADLRVRENPDPMRLSVRLATTPMRSALAATHQPRPETPCRGVRR